jgi:hypothetical protein
MIRRARGRMSFTSSLLQRYESRQPLSHAGPDDARGHRSRCRAGAQRSGDALCTNDFHRAGLGPSRSPSSSGHDDCKLGLRRRSPAPAHRSRRQAVPSCRTCRRDRESVIAHVQATVRGVAAMNAIWILTPGPIAERVTSTTSSTDDWRIAVEPSSGRTGSQPDCITQLSTVAITRRSSPGSSLHRRAMLDRRELIQMRCPARQARNSSACGLFRG